MASRGMSSTLSIISARKASLPRSTGAKDMPQLPIIAVVTPCHELEVMKGSQPTWASKWVCRSTKPGDTVRPVASISRLASAPVRSPTTVMRSPSMATSARIASLPVPSRTAPPRMIRS